MDSNHRSHRRQIYSLIPLATREPAHIKMIKIRAGGRTRTPDLLITNQLLYQLSYTSKKIFKKVGRDGFEPSKSSTSDLQSDPFGHSGTCPYKNDKNKSWWTDSNPRPADYKSAALPTELHQQNNVLYIII